MAIQLTIDEMLEILKNEGSPAFDQCKASAESLARALAASIEALEPRLKWRGTARHEPLGFAGTCAQFEPREVGPVPKCLEDIDVEIQQWKDMCLEMAETVQLVESPGSPGLFLLVTPSDRLDFFDLSV